MMKIDETQRIAAELKELRQKRGLTLRALEELSGVPNPNIAKIEKGTHSPSIRTLSSLTKALGVRIELVSED